MVARFITLVIRTLSISSTVNNVDVMCHGDIYGGCVKTVSTLDAAKKL